MTVNVILQEVANKIQELNRSVSELQNRQTGGLWTLNYRSLTISSGAIDIVAGAFYIVEPESGTSDNLDTINNGFSGKIIGIRPSSGNTITLRHGVDNINLPGGANVALDDPNVLYSLVYDGDQSAWIPFTSQQVTAPAPAVPTEVAGRINLGSIKDIIILGGEFSLTDGRSFYRMSAESGISDTLDTINGGTDGDFIVIRPANGHTIIASDGTGNLNVDGSKTLNDPQDKLTLIYDAAISQWCQISWAGN